ILKNTSSLTEMFSPNVLRDVYPVTPGGELHPLSCSVTMRLLLLVVMAALSLGPAAVSGADKKKLQIGIKKRVDNCPIKSRKGDVLNMHYTGKLEDGTEFDSSIPRDRPFTFTLGTGQVIKGWDQDAKRRRRRTLQVELGAKDVKETFFG
uniref:peptidylprolyl isomerase n=1 Tax=Xiphophorus couchianus TaxID=32473 RepID=A0A3B5M3C2_9TELE